MTETAPNYKDDKQPINVDINDIVLFEDFVKQHQQFRLSQLKWMARNRDRNGLKEAGAVLVIARKYYINKPKFAAWLQSQSN